MLKELQIDDSVVQPRMALSQDQPREEHHGRARSSSSRPGWSQRGEQLAKVYEKYIQGLKDNGALDFDDLLLKAVELLDKAPHVREKYAEKFRFVMVDEYQDTNRPQYHLIQRLSERHRNLAVVGDPDQSIYRWRGADLRNILDFEHDFPEAKIVKLERNYRSTQVILDAASAVISQNRNRKEKRLWTDRKGGALIKYFRGSDELEEADFITRTAHSGISSAPDCTVAVLYRTNAQSRVIEDSLMRSGLSYRIVGGVRFYERKEIKDALAYLKLLMNPHDDVSLRRVINVPARGIGKGVLDSVDRVSADEAPPLLLASGIAVPAPELALDEAEPRHRRAPRSAARARPRCARSAISSSTCRRSHGRSRSRSRSARFSIRPAICRTCARTGARSRRAASRTSWSSCRPRASTRAASPRRRSAASPTSSRCFRKPTRDRAASKRASGS